MFETKQKKKNEEKKHTRGKTKTNLPFRLRHAHDFERRSI